MKEYKDSKNKPTKERRISLKEGIPTKQNRTSKDSQIYGIP